MAQKAMRLGDILVFADILSRGEVELAYYVQRRSEQHRRIGEILVEYGFCDMAAIDAALRQQEMVTHFNGPSPDAS